MAHITTGQVTITTSPTLIYEADADGVHLVVHNDDPAQVKVLYLGPADVTISTGLLLHDRDGPLQLILPANTNLYGVAETGTVPCSYLVVDI